MKRYMKGPNLKGTMHSMAEVEEPFIRTALFFRGEELAKLRVLSASSGAPVAELVRRAVDAYLDSRRDEWEPHIKKSK